MKLVTKIDDERSQKLKLASTRMKLALRHDELILDHCDKKSRLESMTYKSHADQYFIGIVSIQSAPVTYTIQHPII